MQQTRKTKKSSDKIARLEKAIELVEGNCVVLLKHGKAVVHSGDKKYEVTYLGERKAISIQESQRNPNLIFCPCLNYAFNRDDSDHLCKHLYASQIKAGVYKLVHNVEVKNQ